MIKIIMNNYIRVPCKMPGVEKIKKAFTILNPEFASIMRFKKLKEKDWPKGGFYLYRSKEKGKWTTRRIPQYLYYWEENKYLLLPRSSFWRLKPLIKEKYKLIKKYDQILPNKFTFVGDLKESKGQRAITKLTAYNGIIQAPTGSGKTVMALWKIAQISVKTCIIVDTGELAEQWKNRAKQFLKCKTGFIGGGQTNIKPLTIALMQTLRDRPELLKHFSCLIVDECHIAATDSYEKIINNFKGRYVYGLSATPTRKDGKTEVMKWLLGPIRTVINYADAERTPAKVLILPTRWKTKINLTYKYAKGIKELVNDDKRNKLIADQIMKNIDRFGIHLVLSRRKEHLYNIQNKLPEMAQMLSRVLVGSIKKEDRKEIVKEAAAGKLKIIFATDQLLGKGFDEPLLSVLHLAMPIKDTEFLKQCIGRITRIHPKKKESYIIDYWDNMERVLSYTVKNRIETYDLLKIRREKNDPNK